MQSGLDKGMESESEMWWWSPFCCVLEAVGAKLCKFSEGYEYYAAKDNYISHLVTCILYIVIMLESGDYADG